MVTRLHRGVLPSKSAGHPLSSLQRTPFLPSHSPSQVAIGVSVGIGHPLGLVAVHQERGRQVFRPVGTEQSQPSPPSNNHLPRGQRDAWSPGSGYFLPPQSELLRGLWLEKRCPTAPHPHLPLNLCGRGKEQPVHTGDWV